LAFDRKYRATTAIAASKVAFNESEKLSTIFCLSRAQVCANPVLICDMAVVGRHRHAAFIDDAGQS